MVYNLHLKDTIQFNFSKYIEYVAKTENIELYEELEKEEETIIDTLYKKVYGKDLWEGLKNKILCSNRIIYYDLPMNLVSYILKQNGRDINLSHSNMDYRIKCNYPYIPSIFSSLGKSDLYKISELVADTLIIKHEIEKYLIQKGIFSKDGIILVDTWEKLLSLCPNCIDWWIEDFLTNQEFYDRVVLITPEQDLENLKNALRS